MFPRCSSGPIRSLRLAPNPSVTNDPNASNRFDVPFSANIGFDMSLAGTLSVTLTGDVTGSTISNIVDGNTVSFLICQDAAGGHAFNWPSNVLGGMQVGT